MVNGAVAPMTPTGVSPGVRALGSRALAPVLLPSARRRSSLRGLPGAVGRSGHGDGEGCTGAPEEPADGGVLVRESVVASMFIVCALACTPAKDGEVGREPVDQASPAEVTALAAEAGDGEVSLSWTNPGDDDLAGLSISSVPAEGALSSAVTLPGSATSSKVTGLSNGTLYTFLVKTLDRSGNLSEGRSVSATPMAADTAPPAEVTALDADVGDGQVTLSWMNPGDADFAGLSISSVPAEGSLSSGMMLSAPATSLTVTGLTNGKSYTFTVRTVDGGGHASVGQTLSVAPAAGEYSAQVTLATALLKDGTVRISWTNPRDDGLARVAVYHGSSRIGDVTDAVDSAVYGNYSFLETSRADLAVNGEVLTLRAVDSRGRKGPPIEVVVTDTGLPLLVVDTDDVEVAVRNEYIKGTMQSFDGGPAATYGLEIAVRGNATASYPKKPFKLKLDSKAGLLGMPSARRWTLLAGFTDKTLLRTEMGYRTAEVLGLPHVPRRRYVDLILNGEYIGNYLLSESVEQGADRVPVDEGTGYIIENDVNYWSGEPIYFRTSAYEIYYTFKHPDPDELTAESPSYVHIRDFMEELEAALASPAFEDPAIGYPRYIDADSFARWLLVHETMANMDTNYYYHKRDNTGSSRLAMGPVWDFEWSLGIGWYDGPRPREAEYLTQSQSTYLARLLSDPGFVSMLRAIWTDRHAEVLTLKSWMQSKAVEIYKSQAVNFARWPILGEQVSVGGIPLGSFDAELACDAEFLDRRLVWMESYVDSLSAR
jgi:hypothetical protein